MSLAPRLLMQENLISRKKRLVIDSLEALSDPGRWLCRPRYRVPGHGSFVNAAHKVLLVHKGLDLHLRRRR